MTLPIPEELRPTLVSDEPLPLAPATPTSLAETGLSADTMTSLLLKTLYTGELSGRELAEHVGIPYAILEGLIGHARVELLIEVRSASGAGTAGYRYALTDRGRQRAQQFFEICGYVGAAPVPLDQYVRYVKRLSEENIPIDRERVASAFKHLIVKDEVLDQLGPAISMGRAMFLYGPPGNGKSAMGAGIGRVMGGAVYIPQALEIDGQVVTMLDPVNHVPEPLAQNSTLLRSAAATDPRWVRVQRPVLTVGGELTLDALDLKFNHLARFYEAPVQLKANCGVLLVDDFGRQRVAANELLNRWIVPLEAQVDYLTLHTGRKFEIPFNVFVVFATNLEPRSLADEAFLRRIPYKVLAKNPTVEQFSEIFRLNCDQQNVTFDPELVEYLCSEYYEGRGFEMRACHPRDLINQVVTLCRYRKQEIEITTELLDAACRTYFLDAPVTGTQAVAK